MIAARARRAAAIRHPQMDWFSKRPEHQVNATRLRGRPSVTEISPALLVGEFPRPEDIAWLKSEFGVTAIHNLQDDEDLAHNGLREASSPRPAARVASNSSARRSRMAARTRWPSGSPIRWARWRASSAPGSAFTCTAMPGSIARRRSRSPICARTAKCRSTRLARTSRGARTCGPFMTILEDYFGPRDHKPGK